MEYIDAGQTREVCIETAENHGDCETSGLILFEHIRKEDNRWVVGKYRRAESETGPIQRVGLLLQVQPSDQRLNLSYQQSTCRECLRRRPVPTELRLPSITRYDSRTIPLPRV